MGTGGVSQPRRRACIRYPREWSRPSTRQPRGREVVIGLVEEAGMARVREAEEYVVTNRAEAEMIDRTACAVHVRGFPPLVSDEPPSRGGQDRGQSPLELLLASLCACTNVTTGRMADKLRFEYSRLEMHAAGELDTRGRRGLADVPGHHQGVRVHGTNTTHEPKEGV